MKNEELKHSIDNGLSMITSILGEEEHFEHYNHNHDGLGRFASTPGGAKYEKKLDKIQTKIDSNNSKIEGYKKKINPRKKIKAEKLRTKSTKYEKANTKAKLKEIKGKEVSDRLAKKANKYSELNSKADLIDSKNIKWEQKVSELEAKNEKYQAKIDKVLSKMEKAMMNKMPNAELSEKVKERSDYIKSLNDDLQNSKYFKRADTGYGGGIYDFFSNERNDVFIAIHVDVFDDEYPKVDFKKIDSDIDHILTGGIDNDAKSELDKNIGNYKEFSGNLDYRKNKTKEEYLKSLKVDQIDANPNLGLYDVYYTNGDDDWLVTIGKNRKVKSVEYYR